MGNRFKAKTITLSLFLSVILTTGTIASVFSSSSFIKVQALLDYGLENDKNYYKFQKDSTIIKKKNCINDNININGINAGNVNIGNKGQAAAASTDGEEGYFGAYSSGDGGYDGERYYGEGHSNKKDKGFDCIINNNNNNTNIVGGGNQTIPPEEPTENNVYVVWDDSTPGNFPSEILFAISNDNGQTFSMPENISNNAGDSGDAQISSEGNSVYVVWREGIIGNAEILFAISNDNGQTFSMPENISNNAGFSSEPLILSEGNNVYVVWHDDTPGNGDIFFAVSTDGGLTFSEPENISENVGNSFNPQISTKGDNVYVVWEDTTLGNNDILFAASNDNGQTFSMPENISNNAGSSRLPQISSVGNNVDVVWQDDTPGNFEIFFTVSRDNGQTFSMPANLSNNIGDSLDPQISTEGNNVYVVWAEGTVGEDAIFFVVSNNNGQTFSTPENISNTTGSSGFPQISSEGNNVYVAWLDDTTGTRDIFFAASNDNGQTFSNSENISNKAGNAETTPQISSEGNNVYVVWEDEEFIIGGNFDIFFAASNDNGQTFSTPADNLSNNAGDSIGPRISSSTS